MSSFATAPSRSPDTDNQNGNQLHLLNPDAPFETAEIEAPRAAGSQTIDDVNRVERLLSQLEARSLALIPYGYGNLREVPTQKSNKGLIAGILVAVWITSLVLAVAYVRYVNRAPALSEHAAATAPIVLAPEPDPQEQKVANSVDHLAKALVSSSERMTELQAAMDRSNRDLQRIAAKVNTERPKPPSAAPAPGLASDLAEPSPNAVTVTASETLPKNWHRVLEIKPTDLAVSHRNAEGSIDYWIVPRGSDPKPSKVLPIGTSAEGVIIHNLEDGKDYTLTPSGEWRNGALAAAAH